MERTVKNCEKTKENSKIRNEREYWGIRLKGALNCNRITITKKKKKEKGKTATGEEEGFKRERKVYGGLWEYKIKSSNKNQNQNRKGKGSVFDLKFL